MVRVLGDHVDDNGYMSASSQKLPNPYRPYYPCWYRDLSNVLMSLTDIYSFGKRHYPKFMSAEIGEARVLSSKLLGFSWGSVAQHLDRIRAGVNTPLEDAAAFRSLACHIGARVGPNGALLEMQRDDLTITDTDNGKNQGLRQYDTLPLLFLSAERYIAAFGIGEADAAVRVISKNAGLFLDYLAKIYKTECFNVWEMDGHMVHSYDVAAIHRGIRSLQRISRAAGVQIDEEKAERTLADIDDFLRLHFIRNGILYKAKNVFGKDGGFETDPVPAVDAAAILVFNYFTPPCITKDVEMRTMREIEEKLVGEYNFYPVRYNMHPDHVDRYFYGGRWALLGHEQAVWYLKNGMAEKAERILQYTENKYFFNGSRLLPEQEFVDPASPGSDPEGYYARNGNRMIPDLAWSEASYANAAIASLEEAARGNSMGVALSALAHLLRPAASIRSSLRPSTTQTSSIV